MPTHRRLLPTLPLLLLLPLLCGFTPFTPVTNVCPKCPRPPSDVVVLTSGAKVRCKVLAQNSEYYVITRHGELRAVEKGEVSAVQRPPGAPALGSGDQILRPNGVVLHGAIVEEVLGRYLVIQVGAMKHVVWNSQIKTVHKQGKLHSLEAAAAPAAPTPAP